MERVHPLLTLMVCIFSNVPREMPLSHRFSRLKVRAKVTTFHAHYRRICTLSGLTSGALNEAGLRANIALLKASFQPEWTADWQIVFLYIYFAK